MQDLPESHSGAEPMALGVGRMAATSVLRVIRYASTIGAVAGAWYLVDGIRLTWKTGKVDCAIGIGILLMLFSAGCAAVRQWRSQPR